LRTKILIGASLAFLTATIYLFISYGELVYFVAFHKPLHIGWQGTVSAYVPPVLPSFKVTPAIARQSVIPGETQSIHLSVLPNKATSAYVEVWIESPANKQVFRSNVAGDPTQFVQGAEQTFSFSYKLPSTLPKGTYHVSVIITSPNNQTDYYVNENFGTFTVS
jgi:hypothetical protein